MIDLPHGVRRAALENRLQAIQQLRASLHEQQRQLPIAANESSWSGLARTQFDDNLRHLVALWSEALDELTRAECATRNAIDQVDIGGE